MAGRALAAFDRAPQGDNAGEPGAGDAGAEDTTPRAAEPRGAEG